MGRGDNKLQINQYTAYSMVSATEVLNSIQKDDVIELIEKFNGIKNINDAKKYLKTKFDIVDSVLNFPLGGNNFISVRENNKKYSVNIVVNSKEEPENITFCYRK